MVMGAIAVNLVISAICLYLAVQLRRIGRKAQKAARSIDKAERATYRVLHRAPSAIATAHRGTAKLRQKHAALERQWQATQQLLELVSLLGRLVWGRQWGRKGGTFNEK